MGFAIWKSFSARPGMELRVCSSWRNPLCARPVIPAKAGIHKGDRRLERKAIAAGHDGTPCSAIPLALRVRCTGQCTGGKRHWIPAFAGMTGSANPCPTTGFKGLSEPLIGKARTDIRNAALNIAPISHKIGRPGIFPAGHGPERGRRAPASSGAKRRKTAAARCRPGGLSLPLRQSQYCKKTLPAI